jgi:hypothetical protein
VRSRTMRRRSRFSPPADPIRTLRRLSADKMLLVHPVDLLLRITPTSVYLDINMEVNDYHQKSAQERLGHNNPAIFISSLRNQLSLTPLIHWFTALYLLLFSTGHSSELAIAMRKRVTLNSRTAVFPFLAVTVSIFSRFYIAIFPSKPSSSIC